MRGFMRVQTCRAPYALKISHSLRSREGFSWIGLAHLAAASYGIAVQYWYCL